MVMRTLVGAQLYIGLRDRQQGRTEEASPSLSLALEPRRDLFRVSYTPQQLAKEHPNWKIQTTQNI